MSRGPAWLLVTLAVLAVPALAGDIAVAEVGTRLTAHSVVRGDFEQRRQLTGIERPLVSSGRFLLSRAHGLLWLVRAPLAADYKFLPGGVFQRLRGRDWQPATGSAGPAERYLKIMLSVMSGDLPALERDFAISSAGTGAAWTLTLRPRSALLARSLVAISVTGRAWIDSVVIEERSGNRTTIGIVVQPGAAALSDAEVREFAP